MLMKKIVDKLEKVDKRKINKGLVSDTLNCINSIFPENKIKKEDLTHLISFDNSTLLNMGVYYLWAKEQSGVPLTKNEILFGKLFLISYHEHFLIKDKSDFIKKLVEIDDKTFIISKNIEFNETQETKLRELIKKAPDVNILGLEETFDLISSKDMNDENREEILSKQNVYEVFPSYHLKEFLESHIPNDYLDFINSIDVYEKAFKGKYSFFYQMELDLYYLLYSFLPKEFYQIFFNHFLSIYQNNLSYVVSDEIIDTTESIVKFEKDYVLSDLKVGDEGCREYFIDNVRKWWD